MNTWHIDPMHSEIAFKVKHLMISTVRGTFGTFEGSIAAADDTFANATINFSADTASINTKSPQRDGHLQGPDFFDAAQFPKLTFVSTKVEKVDDSNLKVTGDITMKGVTKPIELTVVFNGISKGMDGKRVAAFELHGQLNRQDFGLTWNAPVETGGVVVSDAVVIEATIEVKEA